MKLEVGKFYKTRDGHKVRIYALDGLYGSQYEVHGAMLRNGFGREEWEVTTWCADGIMWPGNEDEEDIVGEWPESATFEKMAQRLPDIRNINERLYFGTPKCECGGSSVGAGHSSWCPAFEGDKK